MKETLLIVTFVAAGFVYAWTQTDVGTNARARDLHSANSFATISNSIRKSIASTYVGVTNGVNNWNTASNRSNTVHTNWWPGPTNAVPGKTPGSNPGRGTGSTGPV